MSAISHGETIPHSFISKTVTLNSMQSHSYGTYVQKFDSLSQPDIPS